MSEGQASSRRHWKLSTCQKFGQADGTALDALVERTYLSGCQAHDRRTWAEASQTPSSAKHGGTENQLPVDSCVCRHRRIVFQGGGVPDSLLYTARSNACWAIRGRATGCEFSKSSLRPLSLLRLGLYGIETRHPFGRPKPSPC